MNATKDQHKVVNRKYRMTTDGKSDKIGQYKKWLETSVAVISNIQLEPVIIKYRLTTYVLSVRWSNSWEALAQSYCEATLPNISEQTPTHQKGLCFFGSTQDYLLPWNAKKLIDRSSDEQSPNLQKQINLFYTFVSISLVWTLLPKITRGVRRHTTRIFSCRVLNSKKGRHPKLSCRLFFTQLE